MTEHEPIREKKTAEKLPKVAESDIERARKSLEKRQQEQSPEQLEELRSTIDKHAEAASEHRPKKAERDQQPSVSVADKKQSYTQTMHRVRSRLNPAGKAFSAVIHTPGIEQASELAGKTIGRPSGILGGGIVTTLGVGGVFFVAHRNGFALSGSEFILLLIAGWILGILSEGLIKIFRRR